MYAQSLAELSCGLRRGEFSSVELTRSCLERIERYDSALNCFITVNAERALAAAQQADRRRSRGETGELLGLPFAAKDIFCTAGVKTSCGSRMLDNFVAPYDATVIERLQNAGMVLVGKTNMDEFAMGSSNETSYYGPVKNPWETERVPGGSSGGSAAAVAARLAPAAIGTDTGGSIRQPSAFCGITGLKPTYGRVSRFGMIAFASSLDQGGPMAASAEDCALLLKAMAGFDRKDSTSLEMEVPDYTDALDAPLKGLRVGIPDEFFGAALNAQIAEQLENAVEEFKSLGAVIENIALPHAELSIPAYYVVAPAECSSNLSRYDGVRFGYRCENPTDLMDLFCRSRAEGFGMEVKRRIIIGTYVLSAGYYDAYYLKAQRVRRLIRDDFQNAFRRVDLILGPVTPTVAFRIGEKMNKPLDMYLSDIYTISANLAGLPAMSVPAGFVDGLPVGLQIIGNYHCEGLMLNAAHQYQGLTDWHKSLPGAFA